MKHLKTYENNLPKITKKYIIIKSNRVDIPYYILEIDDVTDKLLTYSGYAYYYSEEYQYTKKEGELQIHFKDKHFQGEIRLDDRDTLREILYQTDDFDKAVEILDVIIGTKNYNL